MRFTVIEWYPIELLKPDKMVLLCGPSGYSNVSHRVEVGFLSSNGKHIKTYDNDFFTDGGPEATHWTHLPEFPELPVTKEDVNSVLLDILKSIRNTLANEENMSKSDFLLLMDKIQSSLTVIDKYVSDD